MLAREAGLHPSQLSKWRRGREVRSSSDMVAEPENPNIPPEPSPRAQSAR
jgi:transposase-like protein